MFRFVVRQRVRAVLRTESSLERPARENERPLLGQQPRRRPLEGAESETRALVGGVEVEGDEVVSRAIQGALGAPY